MLGSSKVSHGRPRLSEDVGSHPLEIATTEALEGTARSDVAVYDNVRDCDRAEVAVDDYDTQAQAGSPSDMPPSYSSLP